MPLDRSLTQFAQLFANKMTNEQVAIFAGAGLSAGVGFVDWAGLLAPFADELELDVARERENLVRLAQYSTNKRAGNRAHLDHALVSAFPVMHAPGQNHEILARLPIDTFWTTNYDKLIESALRSQKKVVDVKFREAQLPISTPRRDAVVYKMHGDVEHPNEAVLTRDDYESYSRQFPGFINALLGDLTGKTFLFLGFSFTDPNLSHVLSEVRQRYQKGQREHYCLMRRVKRKDYKNKTEFTYAQAHQQHFIKDLARFNVTALMMEEYSEVGELLGLIEQYYRRRSVFVSGSAEDFSPWGEDEVEAFLRQVGAAIVSKELKLVSGFGKGIGNALISGAIEQAHASGQIHLEHYLDVRPFPRAISDSSTRAAVWRSYRAQMLQQPGIAFFFFGNKQENGKVVLADGLRKEFEIAMAQGVLPIPVGGTGSMSAELANEVLQRFDEIFPASDKRVKAAMVKLNERPVRLDELLPHLLGLLDILTLQK